MAAKNVIQNFPENPEPAVTRNSSKKFPHLVIVRAPSLFAMDYKIQEIVEELGVPNSTLRDWLRKGVSNQMKATSCGIITVIVIDNPALKNNLNNFELYNHHRVPGAYQPALDKDSAG
ncbi:MAG: MerR family transcriptional regulator [Anaerolineales bacterium]|nr:MerR family transcriptional regulator [Anaerolineales bacterium]